VVLHHFTKNVGAGNTRERFADSNQILASASMDIRFESTLRPDGCRDIKMTGNGRGSFANQTWHVLSKSETEYELVGIGETGQSDLLFRDEAILKVIRASNGLTAEAVSLATGYNSQTVKNRLTAMTKDQRVCVVGKSGKAFLYGVQQDTLERFSEPA
jgi:hypothetical protein